MLMNAVLPPPSATRMAFATIPSALTTVLANRDTRLPMAKGVKVTDTLFSNCTTKTVVGFTIGTLRFATARCCYGYEKSNLLPVTSAHALQYGFPAVACFSTTAKYFVWRSPQHVNINFHFHAIFMIISLFSEVKFKD